MSSDPDQIREQIEETPTSLSKDVNALADTVNPRMPQNARQQAQVAVRLIAVGAGWLAGSLLPASSAEERAAAKVKDAGVPAVNGAAKDAAASLQP
jgi:hypothetical protein